METNAQRAVRNAFDIYNFSLRTCGLPELTLDEAQARYASDAKFRDLVALLVAAQIKGALKD